MRAVATIGVYGFTAETFLDALRRAEVRQLLDVRRRRAVRGSEYAWANARRLQTALADAGVDYRHRLELAPSTELLELQHREDARMGVGPRSRSELAREYREPYVHEVLDAVDLGQIVAEMPADGASALMCVERDPKACHRSLIADRLGAEHGAAVTHLRPGGTG